MKKYVIPSCIADYDTLVIANGEFPKSSSVLHHIRQAKYITCCDGAMGECIKLQIHPDVIIGDGDSLSAELHRQYADKVVIIPEQDDNDLSKNVHYCIEHGHQKILIVAATGKREDHTLGNISLLMDYRQRADVIMLTDYGLFIPTSGDCQFVGEKGWQVSLFNFGSTHIDATGLVYPTRAFTNWWQGTLNEMQEDTFTIHADGPYLVFICFEKKHEGNK